MIHPRFILPLLGTLLLQSASAENIPADKTPAPAVKKLTPTPDKAAADKRTTPAVKLPEGPYANETKEQHDARMAWWRDARFGMFIHWGVYSVPAGFYEGNPVAGLGEWIMYNSKMPADKYKAYAKQFNPVKYDADAWVKLAKQAGMKYIIITAKHHDGFAMFPTAASDWNITTTPYGKDVLKPLAEACRKHGIKLGFYYSQAQDWMNGGAGETTAKCKRTMDEYIDQVAVPEVRDLLTNYGEFPAVIWWDTPRDMNEERASKLVELLKLKPGIIHNNRLLKIAAFGKIDMESLKSGKHSVYDGDTETPEQHIPDTGLGERDWESCMTMNKTWGFKSDDDQWKSAKDLLQHLIDIASKGGNYLLNVGPTSEGLIPAASVERLQEIGKWMDINGESIYGTTASPFPKLLWGRCTTKKHEGGTTLYLEVFDWPTDGKLEVPGLLNPVTSAHLLAGGKELRFEKTGESVVIDVPAKAPDPMASVIKIEIQGEPHVIPVRIKPSAAGAITLPSQFADIHADHEASARLVNEKSAPPHIAYWMKSSSWISWDFTQAKPGTYEVVAEISSPTDSKATLEIGNEKLPVTLDKTSGYDDFQPRVLGQMKITGNGDQQFTIRPDKKGWMAVNLQKVTLRPVPPLKNPAQ